MERYTTEQRVIVVKTHYKYGECYAETVRRLRGIFGRQNAPNMSTVQRLIQKFEGTGSTVNRKVAVRRRTTRSLENIAVVHESVTENPQTSIRRRSQQLDISRSTLHRILTKDLHMHAYKMQLLQELKPQDHGQRREFVNWVLENQQEDDDFSKSIIFSDEAHFQLNGYVNTQNCRIWGEENPRVIHEKPLHAERVTVWCGFWAGGIIGPYFFENDAEQAVTVTGVRYRNMLREFLWPLLDGVDIEGMRFQQDGATCHTARETMDFLREKFPGRIISRNGDWNWPPRSCDLSPCDFFLWGHVKSRVYANNPRRIPELKAEIRRVIGEIEPQLCAQVIENFVKRARACQQNRGGHLFDIVFHT